MPIRVEISLKTLIIIALFFLTLLVVYLIRDVLLLLFVAFILKSAISPIVDQVEKHNVSRGLSILLIYVILFAVLVAIFAIILPLFVSQIINLLHNFPIYLTQTSQLFPSVQNQDWIASLSREFATFSSNIFRITLSVFSVILSITSIAVLTFYLLLDEKNLKERLEAVIPKEYRKQAIRILLNVEKRLGSWVRGQLILSLIVGSLYFIGLFFLRIPNPLALALIAGVFEIIPFIGPVLAAIPAILIALTISPWHALAVITLFLVIQQLEGHLIVPKVMERVTGLSPLVVLIAILVGGRIGGAIGVFVGVPFAVVIQVVLYDILHIKEKNRLLAASVDPVLQKK